MIRTANLTLSLSRNAGGLFEGVRRLVQSLVQAGTEEFVFGVQDEFTAADLSAWQPVVASAFKPTWPGKFGYSPRFLEELLALKPDLTHTHGIWGYPSVAATRYSRRNQSPYLISTHGMLDHWAIQNSRWKKAVAYFLYERAHLRGARCLRALCAAEAHAIRELRLRNDIAIIPNGIDLPEIGNHPPTQSCGATWNSEVGNPPWEGVIEPGQKVLLYLGRMHPKKGLANLLLAWAKAQNSQLSTLSSQPPWVLALAGWDQGGHEDELKRLCDELGLSFSDVRDQKSDTREERGKQKTDSKNEFQLSAFKNVRQAQWSVVFLGPQFNEARAACYHYCDAFILPSFSEGLPMVVLEAWANSKPVLMTPQCNLPEGFSSGAAIRIEPNAESIAQGLRTLFQSSISELQSTGSHGRALAAERFAWPRIAEQMKELYEWMLGGGPRPACLADF